MSPGSSATILVQSLCATHQSSCDQCNSYGSGRNLFRTTINGSNPVDVVLCPDCEQSDRMSGYHFI